MKLWYIVSNARSPIALASVAAKSNIFSTKSNIFSTKSTISIKFNISTVHVILLEPNPREYECGRMVRATVIHRRCLLN